MRWKALLLLGSCQYLVIRFVLFFHLPKEKQVRIWLFFKTFYLFIGIRICNILLWIHQTTWTNLFILHILKYTATNNQVIQENINILPISQFRLPSSRFQSLSTSDLTVTEQCSGNRRSDENVKFFPQTSFRNTMKNTNRKPISIHQ